MHHSEQLSFHTNQPLRVHFTHAYFFRIFPTARVNPRKIDLSLRAIMLQHFNFRHSTHMHTQDTRYATSIHSHTTFSHPATLYYKPSSSNCIMYTIYKEYSTRYTDYTYLFPSKCTQSQLFILTRQTDLLLLLPLLFSTQ